MQLARGGGVMQGVHPGLPDQEKVVRPQAVGDAHGVERAGVVGIPAQARLLQIQGLLDFVQKPPLSLGRWVQLGPAQQGIIARHQLAFERAIAIHLAEHDSLGGVVVQVRVVGVLRDSLVEIGQRPIVFQVVEVIVAFVDQTVSGKQARGEADGREERDSQYLYYKTTWDGGGGGGGRGGSQNLFSRGGGGGGGGGGRGGDRGCVSRLA